MTHFYVAGSAVRPPAGSQYGDPATTAIRAFHALCGEEVSYVTTRAFRLLWPRGAEPLSDELHVVDGDAL